MIIIRYYYVCKSREDNTNEARINQNFIMKPQKGEKCYTQLEDNIKMDSEQVGWEDVDLIHLLKCNEKCRLISNTVTKVYIITCHSSM